MLPRIQFPRPVTDKIKFPILRSAPPPFSQIYAASRRIAPPKCRSDSAQKKLQRSMGDTHRCAAKVLSDKVISAVIFLFLPAIRHSLNHHTIQEGDDLTAAAVQIGREGRCGSTGRNLFIHRPQNRVVVISPGFHIGEGIFNVRRGRLLRAPQEGDDLRTGAVRFGAEGGLGSP